MHARRPPRCHPSPHASTRSRDRRRALQRTRDLRRHARRDLEALSAAGIPVYPQPGRNGGWQLIGGARTDLSGLTAPEARALFLLVGPAASVDPEAKAALAQARSSRFPRPSATMPQLPPRRSCSTRRAGAHLRESARPLVDVLQDAVGAPPTRAPHLRGVGPRPGRAARRPVGPRRQGRAVVPARRRSTERERTYRVDRIQAVIVTDEAVRASERPRPGRRVGARGWGRAGTACRGIHDPDRRRGDRAVPARVAWS